MNLQNRLKFLAVAIVTMVLVLFGVIVLTGMNQMQLNRAQEVRFTSHLLASELRQSSDDLTRLARTYVVTGDSKYEAQYWDVLSVRNGQKPRPDGRTVSLRKLMEDIGFTAEEFGKLKEAENNSNNLVTTETIAMNAVKGLYNDGSGNYVKKGAPDFEMARRIMHDEKYHSDKAIIGKPIDQFEAMLESRTSATVAGYVMRGNACLMIIGILVIGIGVLILAIARNVRMIVSEIVVQLDRSSQTATEAGQVLVATSEELSAATNQQASAIHESVASIQEIKSMVARNADHAKTSHQESLRSREQAEVGKSNVVEMIHSIEEIRKSNTDIASEVERGNRRLAEIVDVINEIGSKTKVINDIVFQTKLLSFNASVESARAGEHGKGFAVVAEEIGSLAQMSGTAATEISTMLDGSGQKVQNIVTETQRRVAELIQLGNQKITQGTQTAEKCGKILDSIVETVARLNEMIDQIASASEEQAKGVHQITETMNSLDQATVSNASSATSVADSSKKIAEGSMQLQSLVQDLNKLVKRSA